MSEHPADLRQPAERLRPTVMEIFNSAGLYNVDGLPLQATRVGDYDGAGGLELEPYHRGDSPSRDRVDIPYNATWFKYLRQNYGGALQLLGEIRQSYADLCRDGQSLSGQDILSVYHMGVQLPQFLLWRHDNPYKNGDIPAAPTVLRQALLGVGTVLLRAPVDKVVRLSGQDIAKRAESNGDLVGDPNPGEVPRMVCPAAPSMIRGLGQALLEGDPHRDNGSNLLQEYSVDIGKLKDFAGFMQAYSQLMDKLQQQVLALKQEPAATKAASLFVKPQTKLERYDQLVADLCGSLNERQITVYDALGRTDTPRPMTKERIYRYNRDLLMSRTLFMTYLDNPTLDPAINFIY